MGENGGSFGVFAAAGRVRLLDSAPRARRNCNLDLNNVASKCPDLLCEPQAGRAVSRHLQLERTVVVVFLLLSAVVVMGRLPGVWARSGGNGWGECGEAIGIFGWERNL